MSKLYCAQLKHPCLGAACQFWNGTTCGLYQKGKEANYGIMAHP
jgi:hypothetical protein